MLRERLHAAIKDFKKALMGYEIWLHLAKMEVRQRYKRSILGPWWISLSMLIFILSMSVVFSRLFKENLKEYIPFFAAGYLTWQLINNCINEAPNLFRNSSCYIKQLNLPYNLYVFKHILRHIIIYMHNFVVFSLLFLVFDIKINFVSFLFLPGLFLLLINLYFTSLLIGLLSTRYRDIAPIVNNCMQVLFFITPVSWMPKLLSSDSLILKLNPFVYFLEIIRNPLLGILPSSQAWVACLNITLLISCVGITVFSYARTRIIFWMD